MDLLWRVVTSVLISGRSHNVRCAFDPEHDRLIIHDDGEPLERRRIVGWGKLGRAFVSPETRERQDAAIQSRDIYALRRDAGAAVHRACERIRIISQETDSARSVHVLWSSKVFTSGERIAVTYGPRAQFQQGMTMLVVVSSAITPWMRHLKHFFPFIIEDDSLWKNLAVSRNLQTAYHAVDTPVRDTLSAGIPSPQANVVTPLPKIGSVHDNINNNNVNNQQQQQQQKRGGSFSSSSSSQGLSPLPLNSNKNTNNNSAAAAACASSSNSNSNSNSTTATQQLFPITITDFDDTSSSSPSQNLVVKQQTNNNNNNTNSNANNNNSDTTNSLAAPCSACSRRLPPSLVIFVETCNHVICVECSTACARYYADVPLATTYSCPCPAARCHNLLQPHELRPLLSSHEWDNLEVNEMRIAVESGITCPSCKMVFESVKIATVAGDPLENRFVCSMCNASFCVSCGAHPFHDGRPCRDVTQKGQPTCRYCNNPAICMTPLICGDPGCVEKSLRACTVSKPCGHLCHGTKGESNCCSCLEPDCSLRSANVDVCKDDLCTICYCESLSEAPCVELACGHVFHTACLEARIDHKWPTAAVSYRFLDCPLCGRPIAHSLLGPVLAPLQRARDALESRYIERLRIEGLLDHPTIVNPNSSFYNAPVSWARANLTYFECFQCKKPYFGGIRGCADVEDPEMDNPPREQLICAGCSLKEHAKNSDLLCQEHGTAFLEYKCKYCCNLAVWFCWGTTHFCDLCHNPPRKSVRMECPGEELCPIQGKHPPNGSEFLLGCAVCRQEKLASSKSKSVSNNNSNSENNNVVHAAAAAAAAVAVA